MVTIKKPLIFETAFTTYKASGPIGGGGSGNIYEAIDDVGEKWALKLLEPAKITKDKVRRFKNELWFCLRNKHPNIITVVDYGVIIKGEKRSPFYVMPLYAKSLRQVISEGVPTDGILHYFSQLLNGVEAAHLMKVTHRDIKPENVLYDPKKNLLILADFGIAHFQENDLYTAVETKDLARLANFMYAAPEQRDRGRKVDHRADIYALGLILNEMFTGTVPHGTAYKTIGSKYSEYAYLDDLISEMLRQNPDERPQTIEAIKNQLIARGNEFIIQQKISELNQTVVPTTEIEDPLIADPPRLVSFDWKNGKLTLVLNRPVNPKWISAFNNMGGYSSLMGHEPSTFHFESNRATTNAQERVVQTIIDYFKEWLPKANKVYREEIHREQHDAEENFRIRLQQQILEEEVRQRVLKNVKI